MSSELIVLSLAALLTSTFSGVLGMGGGIMLLAVMGQYYDLAVLIPLHALIQLTSNISRTFSHPSAVRWSLVTRFALGAAIGATIASFFTLAIPKNYYQIGLGTFVLIATFSPQLQGSWRIPFKWSIIGGGATFVGTFFGATGPLIAPFYLNEGLKRQQLVGTKAACQTFLHTAKVLVFLSQGFTPTDYWDVLLPMLVMVMTGSILGKYILEKVNEKIFRLTFQILIIILSVRLLYLGLVA